MIEVKRAAASPATAYGDEPTNEADVLLMATSRIQAALPVGWAIRAKNEVSTLDITKMGSRHDAQISLVRNGLPVASYAVEIRRALTSSTLHSAINRLRDEHGSNSSSEAKFRPMLIARYLSSQNQQRLRDSKISYADATGNLHLTSDDPLVLLSDRGANADPWRGPGRPTTSLKGLPAAKLVRALVDFVPPYSVVDLADLAGASLGAAYRLVDYLTAEEVLIRAKRGPITEVNWPVLLRRWSQQANYLDVSPTRGFLEPRGVGRLIENLGNQTRQNYAVSGSLAAQPYAPYAEARLVLIYAKDPMALASEVELRPVESGANTIVVAPRTPVVFERTSIWRGITVVAPSQAVCDLLGGPGRNPAEGDYLLDWMRGNEDAWRRQPDR